MNETIDMMADLLEFNRTESELMYTVAKTNVRKNRKFHIFHSKKNGSNK